MRRNVISVEWKLKGERETYYTLSDFLFYHPEYKRDTINYYLVRKKKPYITNEIHLQRTKLKRKQWGS